jgi:hypothetical protein
MAKPLYEYIVVYHHELTDCTSKGWEYVRQIVESEREGYMDTMQIQTSQPGMQPYYTTQPVQKVAIVRRVKHLLRRETTAPVAVLEAELSKVTTGIARLMDQRTEMREALGRVMEAGMKTCDDYRDQLARKDWQDYSRALIGEQVSFLVGWLVQLRLERSRLAVQVAAVKLLSTIGGSLDYCAPLPEEGLANNHTRKLMLQCRELNVAIGENLREMENDDAE